jgi:IS30 family transposase
MLSVTKDLKELDSCDVADAPQVIAMLFEGKSHDEIADVLGMARASVTRKIHRLMDTREFQNALTEEWIKRYNTMRVDNPREAFKSLTRLVAQTITRHFESSSEVSLTERRELVTVSVRNYEDEIRREVERALQCHGLAKQVDSAQAPPKTGPVPSA